VDASLRKKYSYLSLSNSPSSKTNNLKIRIVPVCIG